MEYHTLRIFVAVAQEGSMSRAAEKMCLSQAAISLQIKQLQNSLDCVLFERTARGMSLTDDGLTLLSSAQKAITAYQDFKRAADRIKNREIRESVKIGTILDPGFIRLGVFIRQLTETATNIEASLHQYMSGEVLLGVENKTIDAGFYLGEPDADIRLLLGSQGKNKVASQQLTQFIYRVIAPVGWEHLIEGKDWADLAKLPWIVTPPHSAHSRLLSGIFSDLGVQPKRGAFADQESSMMNLVKAGVGLSLARDAVARHESQNGEIIYSDSVSVPCTLRFIYLEERQDEPVIQQLRDALNVVWSR